MSEKWVIENREGGRTLGPFTSRDKAVVAAKESEDGPIQIEPARLEALRWWSDSGAGRWHVRRANWKERLFAGASTVVAWILAVVAFLLMLWFWWPFGCIAIGC